MTHAAIVAGTLFGSYGVLWLGEFCWNLVFRAPKAIYAETIHELIAVGTQARLEVERLAETSKARITELERGLDDQLTAVSPDQHDKRKLVADKLHGFTTSDFAFLRWHAHHGRVRDMDYRQSGVPEPAIQDAVGKCRSRGLILDEPRVVGPYFTYVNPEFKEAILHLLRSAPNP